MCEKPLLQRRSAMRKLQALPSSDSAAWGLMPSKSTFAYSAEAMQKTFRHQAKSLPWHSKAP